MFLKNILKHHFRLPISTIVESTTANFSSKKDVKMAVDKRHFDNAYPDFQPHKEINLLDLQAKKVSLKFLNFIIQVL